ncbi:MAG TPA: endolytic transglycosylase MltG [Acidimicrobiales bacterium]|nr:endolytic transglycosylase MltG [Acidimicrobiales bacterium]
MIGLAVFIVGLLGTAVTVQRTVDPPGAAGEEVAVTIPAGSSTARIAAILDEKGVVESARAFRIYTRLKGAGPFQAGDYTLRKRATFGEIVDVLSRGPEIIQDRLTVPEGLTLEQIAERVGKLPGRSAEAFLAAAQSGEIRSTLQPDSVNTLEGLLFPDTYMLDRGDDEKEILQRMVSTFDTVAAETGIDQAAEGGRVTPYEAVVIASLVEREARVAEDRGPIARVIYNRLERDMLLQIDATVLYALGEHKTRVLFSDLEVDSPYNTYRVKGLPPTPIAAPGRAALEAAADPPANDFLYYVVVESDGSHAFASTGAQHQANIRQADENGVR